MIGVDIEEINRFVNKDKAFIERIYTESEIAYCQGYIRPESHFAVRFCAKEAVIKALSGFGINNVFCKDIEVYLDENSVPQINLLKKTDFEIKFQLSLSHSKNNAIAFVTADRVN